MTLVLREGFSLLLSQLPLVFRCYIFHVWWKVDLELGDVGSIRSWYGVQKSPEARDYTTDDFSGKHSFWCSICVVHRVWTDITLDFWCRICILAVSVNIYVLRKQSRRCSLWLCKEGTRLSLSLPDLQTGMQVVLVEENNRILVFHGHQGLQVLTGSTALCVCW